MTQKSDSDTSLGRAKIRIKRKLFERRYYWSTIGVHIDVLKHKKLALAVQKIEDF